MGAINVIFALISSYLFAFSLLIMLFLPLTSIVVALNVEWKIYPIYTIGTLLLSLVLNFANFDNTLFFLFPILVSGLCFGLLMKRQVPDILILIIVTAVNVLTLVITIPLINLIYDIDFFDSFAYFIGFSNIDFGKYILPSILFLLAFMQTLITLIVVTSDAKYFQIEVNHKEWHWGFVLTILVMAFSSLLHLYNPSISLAFFLIIIVLTIYDLFRYYEIKPLFAGIMLLITIFVTMFGFALFENVSSFPSYFGIIIGVTPVIIIDVVLLIKERKNTLNEKLI